MRHKRFFIVITLIAIVGGVSARHHKKAVNKIEKAPVHLNEILTNELSDISSLEGMDQNIESFMREWSIKGASLSIMRNDSLIYAKGYGIADEGEPMKPSTLLRVASVSKLVTATAIMVLKERGLLSLNEKVFAEGGILDEYIPYIKDKRYFDITIKHLLTHQAGFTTRGGDPMFETLSLMKVHKWENLPDSETIIKTQLRRRLGFAPGKGNSYSNFGYLLLSEIIELITGQDYETWTRNNVLIPAGCYDMYLGYTFYKDKLPGESRYFVHSSQNDVECCDGSGELVERCYGGSDFRGLKGAGAWVTSTPELARFVASIDGRDEVPDIISK